MLTRRDLLHRGFLAGVVSCAVVPAVLMPAVKAAAEAVIAGGAAGETGLPQPCCQACRLMLGGGMPGAFSISLQ